MHSIFRIVTNGGLHAEPQLLRGPSDLRIAHPDILLIRDLNKRRSRMVSSADQRTRRGGNPDDSLSLDFLHYLPVVPSGLPREGNENGIQVYRRLRVLRNNRGTRDAVGCTHLGLNRFP